MATQTNIRVRETIDEHGISAAAAERKYKKYGLHRRTLQDQVSAGNIRVLREPTRPGDAKQGKPPTGFVNMQVWQEQIRIAAKRAWKGAPAKGPVLLNTHFFRSVPVRAPQSQEKLAKWKATHIIKKPDRTNYLKACEDALNGIVFVDDSQVLDGVPTKDYVEHRGEQGFTIIEIVELGSEA